MRIDFIDDPTMCDFAEYVIRKHPNYLRTASTRTGKWHPKDEYRPYGNRTHIRRVLNVLESLIDDYEGAPHGSTPDRTLSPMEKNLLRLAALLHDINKATKKASASTGPNVIAQDLHAWFGRGWSNIPWTNKLIELVAVHGGSFYPPSRVNKNVYTYNPNDPLHLLLHLSDYIASRNNIIVRHKSHHKKKNWHHPLWWWFMKFYLKRLFG